MVMPIASPERTEIRVLGGPGRAIVVADSPFDPENQALRG